MFCNGTFIDLAAGYADRAGGIISRTGWNRRRGTGILEARQAIGYLCLYAGRCIYKNLSGAIVGGNSHVGQCLEFFL